MGKTKIKICGLKRPEDIQIANSLKLDYVGFVFAKSSRQITEKIADSLREQLLPEIPAVGVFVREPIARIARLCKEQIIQMIQLHGEEDEEYIKRLRQEVPDIPMIRAVRVRSGEQILEAEKMDCEYLLLDTYIKGTYGGSGQQFDKRLIPRLEKPYFLAGGLDAENVRENIEACHPYAVDVSSAVETDGIKDAVKIQNFIERVRSHE
ncbi:phosphoribosylanthranilate isomerase [Bariatricus sp. SGI.154]|uniref:phosphoribosylanthranilate isomerase n=1 Tax=Bariatricus sp. SGI.154 TaxID=3420549 RepID=UPI003CFBD69F